MDQHLAITPSTTQGHTCVFYEHAHERNQLLVNYFLQGIENNELCIFVASGPLEDSIAVMRAAADALSAAIDNGSLRIFEMNSTYVPDGTFAAEYMLNNVQNFIADAKESGFSGLRTAGEMAWLAQYQDQLDAAVDYERAVNTLNHTEPTFVGLCLYPVKEVGAEITTAALHSHPTMAYKGDILPNPLYAAA